MDQKNVDPALTPKNATIKGYKYIDDIICDVNKPDNNPKDILELINQHGCKLGSPSQSKEINIYRGLYMPLEKNKK
ncbi:hypothetical protein KKE68_01985 [Patescibacteria group bacterium]|nr:hypothetical protein [Patescibacteria group bacterium]